MLTVLAERIIRILEHKLGTIICGILLKSRSCEVEMEKWTLLYTSNPQTGESLQTIWDVLLARLNNKLF